ncbi:MAG: HAMP domain-containing histidine kinase [Clostridia bacterium]|nr:HAMP domain-containing histidine kinase [Clostridia bacterium]MBQ7940771.1 HAMP domain-containing histidine kinase [Clostridia bacterium]
MKLLHSSAAKIVLGALAVILLLTAVAASFLSVIIYAGDVDRMSQAYVESTVFREMLALDEEKIWSAHLRGDDPSEIYKHSNVLFQIKDDAYNIVASSDIPLPNTEADRKLQYTIWRREWYSDDYESPRYHVTLQVNPDLPHSDVYKTLHEGLSTFFPLRYAMPYIAAGCAVLYVILLILLMCTAGHRRKSEEITRSWFDKIPLDLLLGGYILLFALHIAVIDSMWDLPWRVLLALGVAAAFVDAVLLTVFFTSLAVRVKSGTTLKNTVIWQGVLLIWRILTFLWRRIVWPVFRFIGGGIFRFFRFIGFALGSIPLIPKTAILIAVNGVADLLILLITRGVPMIGILFLLIKDACLALILLTSVSMMRKIQVGGERMAAGHLDAPVEEEYLMGDFKKFAHTMNQLGEGMGRAVEERMKSERFRTELITNVSHDIKTPLTSIVNYVDLMKKENVTEEPMAEYIRVLDRQSSRLKKLTEDLIEASKAATGNVAVDLRPCDAAMLIGQIEGEYEERLAGRNLTLIVTKPEHPVTILADGRLMWRVFDNLMSNILKYAMPGSRVYLNLETSDTSACFTFRNMSQDPLNIPGEELLERFTRGDSSRSTEGSGLGLSIANSLTALQKGRLALSTDGDLFKVTLTFPLA